MAGTERQRAKFAAFDAALEPLVAAWCAAVEDPDSPVNVLAVTRALNRYRQHRAGIMAPYGIDNDPAREGRFHVARARIALRQAAALLKVAANV